MKILELSHALLVDETLSNVLSITRQPTKKPRIVRIPSDSIGMMYAGKQGEVPCTFVFVQGQHVAPVLETPEQITKLLLDAAEGK